MYFLADETVFQIAFLPSVDHNGLICDATANCSGLERLVDILNINTKGRAIQALLVVNNAR